MRHSPIEELKTKAKLLVKASKDRGETLTLRDALDQMAGKRGYSTWRSYKEALDQELYNPPTFSSRLNIWFSTYEEARDALNQRPELYLLPFRHQFFLCLPDYIEAMDISSDDPDLALTGHDWVMPDDKAALDRLNSRIKAFRTKSGW